MRILVTADQWFPDFHGGAARVVEATAVQLAARGHQVRAIVPSFPGEQRITTTNGVEIHRVIQRSFLPTNVTDVYETHRAAAHSHDFQPDVVLAHHMASALGSLKVQPRCPVAFVFYGSPYLEARYRRLGGVTYFERARSLSVEPLLYALGRMSLRAVSRILVLSEYSKSLIRNIDSRVANRVRVVGAGVDQTFFTPSADRDALRRLLGISPDVMLLVTARRLVSRMGLEILLDSVSTLRDAAVPVALVVIGEGELRPALEARRDRLNIADVVQFVGRVPDGQLRDWYRAADLFVLPTVAYEGFGMVTAEALACGTPVVGTTAGATGELLGGLHETLLSAPGDATALSQTITAALGLTSSSFRDRCRRYVLEHLSWEVSIERWESELELLTHRYSRAAPGT